MSVILQEIPNTLITKLESYYPLLTQLVYHHLDNCAAAFCRGTNDMSGWDSLGMACSYITTNLVSHRAQMNMGFVYGCRFIILYL